MKKMYFSMTNGVPLVEGKETSLNIIEVCDSTEGPYEEHKEITTSPIEKIDLIGDNMLILYTQEANYLLYRPEYISVLYSDAGNYLVDTDKNITFK